MKKNINYKKLIVNSKNYRFDSVNNQDEAIELMLNEKGREIYNLAKDINNNGLDLTKDFRVIKEKGGGFVVLDGNRRITAVKCLNDNNLIKDVKLRKLFESIEYKDVIEDISCFVYEDEKDAVKWIKLDHTGKNEGVGQDSWGAPEVDRFGHMIEGKISPAMQIVNLVEEYTGDKIDTSKLKISTINRILSNPESRSILGIDVKKGKVEIVDDESGVVQNANKLFNKVIDDDVNVSEVYNKKKSVDFMKNLFEVDAEHEEQIPNTIDYSSIDDKSSEKKDSSKRKTSREKGSVQVFFGEKLYLIKGSTNSIYMDIIDLYDFYTKNEERLSKNFPAMIRMSLRLLIESAVSDKNSIAGYVNSSFVKAKQNLSSDQKTTLANNSISTEKSLIKLLQSGAHNYSNSANFEQTIAMSIIIGGMLNVTHAKVV